MPVTVATFTDCTNAALQHMGSTSMRRAEDAALYLAHVEAAVPLRALSAVSGRGVSSVHRAIRRIEALRDDPLLDRAFDRLEGLARRQFRSDTDFIAEVIEDNPMIHQDTVPRPAHAPTAALDRPTRRALERLAEPDAFLMVASGAEKAGVFSRSNRFRRPLHLLPVAQAADFAARDWVRCTSRTAVSAKYAITPAGRAWLKRDETAPAVETAERTIATAEGESATVRVNLAESPVSWLSRRKGPDGQPLLAPAEVEAAERLREDFELAQMGPRVTQDWQSFLTPRGDMFQGGRGPCEGPSAARERVSRALAELGPGLADVALRVCCFLEGLEAVEGRMGWSARSAKVVLKIALQRLAAHYRL
jgi:hypothetical protein